MVDQTPYIIGITGTPGSGKSTFAKLLSRSVNANVIEINDIAINNKLFSAIDDDNTYVLKIDLVDKYIKKMLRGIDKPTIVVGHIIPELTIDFDIIFVIRCPLSMLMKRLKKRNYSKNKLRENIIAEALDYCNYNIKKRDCPIIELEDTKDKCIAVTAISSHNFKKLEHLNTIKVRSKELHTFIKKNMWLGL